jgi:hypothetical protein
MIWAIRSKCIFKMATDKHMEQLETSKETLLVGNIGYNESAVSGAPIAMIGKWRLKFKRHNGTSRTHSLAP